MSKMDIHADDYGLSLNTSKDILAAVNAGKINSISIMPNMNCFEETLRLWKAGEADLPISIHLNFMEGYSCGEKERLSCLVDEQGLFNISWADLIRYNYSLRKRELVKQQLKIEVKAQMFRVIDAYHLLEGKKLRIDSHQHTHMIPIVMEAILEVIEEEKLSVEYIRISRELVWPYMKHKELWGNYRLVNIIKVAILNWYSRKGERMLNALDIPPMALCGVFLSGKMSAPCVKALLPDLKKEAARLNRSLELLFHPGSLLEKEAGREFNNEASKRFYFSRNRKIELEAVMELK